MSLSSDAPQEAAKIEARGKVLKFPATPATARKTWPGLKKYGIAAAAVAVLVGGGVVAGLWGLSGRTTVQYNTVPVTRGDISKTVTATGTVNPVLTVIVGSYVSGVIRNLYCDYNTQVKAGQVCAKIDPRPYQATFDQYSGQLLRDEAILDKDRANLARFQKLAEQNSIARQQAEDQAYLVNQDAATVKLDQALVESAKLNLGYTDIVSPVDGTVVSRNVTGGQTVAASFQTPTLFLIATDLKQMEVDTNTSEGDIGGVKVGDKATFTVDAFPQRVFQGAVTQVRQSPQTVQNVVTYDVVVGVENDDLALITGHDGVDPDRDRPAKQRDARARPGFALHARRPFRSCDRGCFDGRSSPCMGVARRRTRRRTRRSRSRRRQLHRDRPRRFPVGRPRHHHRKQRSSKRPVGSAGAAPLRARDGGQTSDRAADHQGRKP